MRWYLLVDGPIEARLGSVDGRATISWVTVGARARLAEVLGTLSLATDLADGVPYEKALRQTVLTQRVGRGLGWSSQVLTDAYYGAVVRSIGCTGFATEAATLGGGDDLGLNAVMAGVDPGQPAAAIRSIVSEVAAHERVDRRLTSVVGLLADRGAPIRHHTAVCDAGVALGRLLGLSDGVLQVLAEAYERFDGGGFPRGVAAGEIDPRTRLVAVCETMELFHHRYGYARMAVELRRRSGGALDPTVVNAALDLGPGLVSGLAESCWDEYLDCEPGTPAVLSDVGLEQTALAFARFTDLKSTWTIGHSELVAALADRAAEVAGYSGEQRRLLRLAGLLHDLGRSAVPNGIWDKPGALNAVEWERVRTHAYHTERILWTSPLFAEIAVIAGQTHERPVGGGYHKGLPGTMLGDEAKLLAVADACAALGEDRAHRPARGMDGVAQVLSEDTAQGRYDREALRHVLEAAGATVHPVPAVWPAGLTDREVAVLRLLARGASTKQIANRLRISGKTVGHHIGHIYDKTGARSRAGAALYAVEHGLLR